MRAYALVGDRANALVTFERCPGVLWEELEVEPAADTVALSEDIKTGRLDDLRLAEKLGSPKGPAHNLPAQATPFIGRHQEVAEIRRLLLDSDCRLVTVVGFGGMGKMRTAIEAAVDEPRIKEVVTCSPVDDSPEQIPRFA